MPKFPVIMLDIWRYKCQNKDTKKVMLNANLGILNDKIYL